MECDDNSKIAKEEITISTNQDAGRTPTEHDTEQKDIQHEATINQDCPEKTLITQEPDIKQLTTEFIFDPSTSETLPKRKKEHSLKFSSTEEKISEEDEYQIEELTASDTIDQTESKCCALDSGPHVTCLSVLYIPCALISSLCVSFYYGAWTWYNLYLYFSEEKTVWHKVTICPLLILTFPFTVGLSSICLSIFASCIQLSWYFRNWKIEILEFDKGFYGWFCDKLGLPHCSPYEMILVNNDSELENLPIRAI